MVTAREASEVSRKLDASRGEMHTILKPRTPDFDDTGFPKSRTMRAIMGHRGRAALAAAGIALAATRPRKALRSIAKVAPAVLMARRAWKSWKG